MEKEFKTYKEQLRLLKKKGLIIDNEEHAIEVLRNVSYFALINGYKNKWQSDNCDRVSLTIKKGTKQSLQDIAKKKGESINGYIKNTVQAHFKADTGKRLSYNGVKFFNLNLKSKQFFYYLFMHNVNSIFS